MRRFLLISAAAVLLLPLAAWRRQSQSDTGSQSQASSSASSTQTQTQPKPQDSLAEAARKARAQKKENPNSKPAKVFTNENLPAAGGISTVGEEAAPAGEESATGGQPAGQGAAQSSGNDEKAWRAKFAELRHKLDQDQAELDVLQREASTDQVQFYGGDPEKATADQMSQQPMGADYNKKLAKLDAKKKQIEADKQAISDAEDELRKAGGDPGWAR